MRNIIQSLDDLYHLMYCVYIYKYFYIYNFIFYFILNILTSKVTKSIPKICIHVYRLRELYVQYARNKIASGVSTETYSFKRVRDRCTVCSIRMYI